MNTINTKQAAMNIRKAKSQVTIATPVITATKALDTKEEVQSKNVRSKQVKRLVIKDGLAVPAAVVAGTTSVVMGKHSYGEYQKYKGTPIEKDWSNYFSLAIPFLVAGLAVYLAKLGLGFDKVWVEPKPDKPKQ